MDSEGFCEPTERSTPTKYTVLPEEPAKYRVRFGSDDESSSEDEDDDLEGVSEADRRLRREYAEEIEKYIASERCNLTRLLTEFPEDTKLTRKKARELDHDIIQMLNLGGIQHDESSAVLAEEFDDEEDDEYKPNDNEEDEASDEYSELSTTCSDIDSQPRTPGSAMGHDDASNEVTRYDEEEGVFKVPGDLPKTPGREETISKRTRSKLSYTATPIEAMEERLPPDFKQNIYDTDLDMDESWQEFLKEFKMPLHALKDEEDLADPEYVALGTEVGDVDVDDGEEIPITADEVNALIDELLDGKGVEFVEKEPQIEPKHCPPSRPAPHSDPNNPCDVVMSNIQPVAIIHTQPSLSPNYEMVLSADNQIYVLSRSDLRRLVPALFRWHPEKPVTNPILTVDVTKDTELLLDEIREYKEAYVQTFRVRFSEEHRRRLQIQLMKHVQLLGTCFIQSYGHSTTFSKANFFIKKLRSLVKFSRKSPTVRLLCWNLRDMYRRCLQWQEELKVESEETRDYFQWLTASSRPTQFHPRVMEFIVTSKAFVFSELLPQIAVGGRKNVPVTDGERKLLVMCFAEMKTRDPQANLRVCGAAYIKHYAPWRPLHSLQWLFRRDKHQCPIISNYRDHGVVPQVIPETMDLASYSDVVTPSQRASGALPSHWDKYVFSDERILRVFPKYVKPSGGISTPQAVSTRPAPSLGPGPVELRAKEKEPLVTLDFQRFKAEFNLPQKQSLFPAIPATKKRRRCSVGSKERPGKTKDASKVGRRREITLKLIERLVNNKPPKCKSLDRKQLTTKLHKLLRDFHASYDDRIACLKESSISTKIFNYLKEFDIFVRLLGVNDAIVTAMDCTSPANEPPTAKRVKLDEEVVGQSSRRSLDLSRRLMKAKRMYENNRRLLQPEPVEVVKERDSLFAWNYAYKVRETYLAEGRPEKIDEFLRLLRNAKPTDSVPVLYNKIEKIFLPDHRELVDTFLSFLLPGHAAQVGKFFEHAMVTSMRTFIAKMNVYFSKQPRHLKKIMNALNELSVEEGVNMATIRQRFLPMLKGNPLLVDWFMQLFPMERPPEPSNDEFEELQTKNELPFEEIPAALILADHSDSAPACGIKYMQGRIQYGNRYILPGDLSFLATSYELEADKPHKSNLSSRKSKRGMNSRQEEAEEEVAEVVVDNDTASDQHVGCVHAVDLPWDVKGEEAEEQSASNSSGRQEPLCDAATLQAHKNRLNPSIGTDSNTATGTADDGKTSSPKKVTEWKTIPMNSKGRRTAVVSPTKTPINTTTTTATTTSPKKVGTPKRKRQPSRTVAAIAEEEKEEVQKEPQKCDEEEAVKTLAEPSEWTREDDKILLEAINGQEDKTEEQILDELIMALPGREREAINTRFQFLINVLKKFS